MKRLAVLVGLAVVMVGVAACSSPTGGQPTPTTPVESTGSNTTGGASESTSTSGGGGGSLPADQPCSLFSSSDLSQLGVTSPPTPDRVGTAADCPLDLPDYSVGVQVFTNSGLSNFKLTGGTAHDTNIGSHPAKEGVDDTKSCVIAIGVGSSSQVDVTATGNGDTDACPTALAVAKLIEPKLP